MAFFHSPNIVTDGLVMYVDAANPKSYPGSGTTWYDVSGNGHNLDLGSSVALATYQNSRVLHFPQDANGYGRNTSLNLNTSNFTVISWVRKLSANNTGRTITAYSNNWLLAHHDDTYGDYYAEGWVNDISSPKSDTVWRMYTGTGHITNDQYSLFINDTNIVRNSPNGAQGPNGWNLNNQYSQYSNCEIGNLLCYNRVLSDDEIIQTYNALKERFIYTYSEGNNAAPYVENWNDATTYTMDQFGGLGKVNAHGYTTGPATFTLTLSSLPVHTEVRYKVFWHLVDSLDTETNQLFTMNSSGTETEKLRFTKRYDLVPAISVQDTGVVAGWSGHQPYSYRPWGNGFYQQDGYLSIDTGWYAHTANSFTARHVIGANQIQADEAQYLSHVQVYFR